jgi:radical SAM superfamily enzyme YgiQ (UPF0313 family)
MLVGSTQYGFLYGNQLHYPYSIGCIVAAALQDELIRRSCSFLPTAVLRSDENEAVKKFANCGVLLCSMYMWNEVITLRTIHSVKKSNPDCLIVVGGPHVPDLPTELLTVADVCIHREGEKAVSAVLRHLIKNGSIDGLSAPGVSTRAAIAKEVYRLTQEEINELPSPYLSGILESLAPARNGIQYIAAWETNRGCPYQCAFCDWGFNLYSKVRIIPEPRLLGEIQWLSDHRIPYIDSCDANFGILPRDIELARALRKMKQATGWPKTFRPSWAKSAPQRAVEIARELQDGGLLKAAGLSVQSLDSEVLSAIHRKNLPVEKFTALSHAFAQAGVPTYTEVIRGLPGESLSSFREGLRVLVDSPISAIAINNCTVLPNTVLATKEYQQKYGIVTRRCPIYLAHSSRAEQYDEYEHIVVATNTANSEDMKQMFYDSWLVLLCHGLGLLRLISDYTSAPRFEFYNRFVSTAVQCCPRWRIEHEYVRAYIENGYAGSGWGQEDDRFADILWPVEEMSWLRLVSSTGALAREFATVLKELGLDTKLAAMQTQRFELPQQQESLHDWGTRVLWHGRQQGVFLKKE